MRWCECGTVCEIVNETSRVNLRTIEQKII